MTTEFIDEPAGSNDAAAAEGRLQHDGTGESNAGDHRTVVTFYREHLDAMRCQQPGCDHVSHDSRIYLHSRCHVESPTWTFYDSTTGGMTVECAECRAVVAVICVASETKETRHA